MIDECRDTNIELVNLLANTDKNIAVVGMIVSICSWRGALIFLYPPISGRLQETAPSSKLEQITMVPKGYSRLLHAIDGFKRQRSDKAQWTDAGDGYQCRCCK